MSSQGRTIRDAIAIALEGLPGSAVGWASSEGPARRALRAHVVGFIADYAQARGVVLDADLDIEPELDRVIAELRGQAVRP